MGQCVKPFNDGCAANDEFQSANSGLQRGELVRDLLRQRVQIPPVPQDSLARPKLDGKITGALGSGNILFIEAPCGTANPTLWSVLSVVPDQTATRSAGLR